MTFEYRDPTLREIAQCFIDTVNTAVRHYESRSLGGQQVSQTGDFTHVPPSAIGQLRRWARDFEEALERESNQ